MSAKTCKKCGGAIHPVRGCTLCPMFASGRTPACKSDGTIFPGHLTGGRQFVNPHVRARYLAKARAAGVTTDGKVYCSALADSPGDPRAWVDNVADQKKLLEERGWAAEGDVKVKGRDPKPAAPVRLAEDLVEAHVERELEARYPDAQNGKVVKIKKAELEAIREAVIEKHGAPKPGAAPKFNLLDKKPAGKAPGKRPKGRKQ